MKSMTRAMAMLVALSAAGCLQKETTSTIYVHPEGSLDWVVLERHVRSDETDPAKRNAEEISYVDAAANDRHGVADGFRALGGTNVRTWFVREDRPYAVMIEARFDNLTTIFENALAGCGVAHEISQTVEGGVTTWRLWANIGVGGEHLEGDNCGESVSGLFDAGHPTIMLVSGVFTKAEGFTLASEDTATLDDDTTLASTLEQRNGQLVLSLSWTAVR